MPDAPARPVIGVRVHTADGSFLHDLGRDWWRHDDGSVDIEAPVNLLDLDEPPAGHTKRTIAAYLPGVVQRVELVLGEPEPTLRFYPPAPAAPVVTSTSPGQRVHVSWDPAEIQSVTASASPAPEGEPSALRRVHAAQRDVVAAQNALRFAELELDVATQVVRNEAAS